MADPAPDKTPRDWAGEYASRRGHHDSLTEELERLVRHVLDEKGISFAQLEARTKTAESFAEKISRKNDKYDNPLEEITDLVGLRIILYYPDDVVAVGQLIEQEFEVDWENSVRQGADTAPDRFGYRSDHYIVHVSQARRALPEWARFAGDCAEIQVRTVMQHAWAAVDHKIRYKSTDLPRSLQRRLSRLSALLEIADEQFASLKRAGDDVLDSYEKSVARGDLEVAIDALSLRAYLDQSGVGERWAKVALDAGFREPFAGTSDDLAFENLLDALQAAAIVSLEQFRRSLARLDARGAVLLRELAERVAAVPGLGHPHLGRVVAVPEDVLAFLILIQLGDGDAIDASAFRDEIKAGLKAVATSAAGRSAPSSR